MDEDRERAPGGRPGPAGSRSTAGVHAVRSLLGLTQLQQLLQSIHGVQAAPVRDFLVDRAFRERHAPLCSPHEALLLRDHGEELHVSLLLDDSVLAQLRRAAADPWTQAPLSAF